MDASAEAYAFLAAPNAILGIGSYAVTLGLVAIGSASPALTRRMYSSG